MSGASWLDRLVARDLLPDPVLSFGIRRLLAGRLAELRTDSEEERTRRLDQLAGDLAESPIALSTDSANEQHYELPTEFFQLVLGDHLKYSSALWPEDRHPGGGGQQEILTVAEEAMLELYLDRGELTDGQRVLELGCGWGSLTLFMASRFPASRIHAVSNSRSQRAYIEAEAERRGFPNVTIETADLNDFQAPAGRFDRVVSVEMFEHMKNYRELHRRIADWLAPGGKLFVHIFCHKSYAYPFEARGPSDWMARYFFTGGLMPSFDLLPRFQDDLALEQSWLLPGTHYEQTARAWLAEMDRNRESILPILEQVYGRDQRRRWWVYWRVFFLACAELFGYRGGEEWGVGHYRFVRRERSTS